MTVVSSMTHRVRPAIVGGLITHQAMRAGGTFNLRRPAADRPVRHELLPDRITLAWPPFVQPLSPRASTGHSSMAPPSVTAITESTRSITGQTWLGITATTSPSAGRDAPADPMTTP